MTIGSRLDNGEKVTKDGKEYKRYKWQINKNAQNATLKELANKDTKTAKRKINIAVLIPCCDLKSAAVKAS
jgi:hypothetical protein